MDRVCGIPYLIFFSILINGSPYHTIHPSKGLRNGDPLSTFLFILDMKGLGRMFQKASV